MTALLRACPLRECGSSAAARRPFGAIDISATRRADALRCEALADQKPHRHGMSALVTAATALQLTVGVGFVSAEDILELPYYSPQVTTDSSKEARAIVNKLNESGAKMYGAFWCSHCFSQKQVFGKEVQDKFPYVECYPDGWQRGASLAQVCSAAGVRAFPSWVINDRLVEGELSLQELNAELAAPAGQPSPTMLAIAAAAAQSE